MRYIAYSPHSSFACYSGMMRPPFSFSWRILSPNRMAGPARAPKPGASGHSLPAVHGAPAG